MASRTDYTVGWVCALPVEVEAAKAILDRIHEDIPADLVVNDTDAYILGSLGGHNVVLAYPASGVYGTTSVADVAARMRESFRSLRFSLMVGIGGGVPGTKEDIRLGDVVVSKPTAGWPGLIHYHSSEQDPGKQDDNDKALIQPSALLLTGACKTETAAIFDESQVPVYVSEIVKKDQVTFAYPGPDEDVFFDPDYNHIANESAADGCNRCNPDEIQSRPPRDTQDPVVHYGLVASGTQPMCDGATRDRYAQERGVLCFETEAAGLKDGVQCLVIRGICDYADSHSSELWHGYAAATSAAYAKEILSFIPTLPKPMSLAANTYAVAAPVLRALLLTRPEVDRASLIGLKGRRVDGTCQWLIQQPVYEDWLTNAASPLLWISGGPGKGKTMLAIYITEVLQPKTDLEEDVLLYYFCSNRDKNRNTAVTIMRGIIHQWLNIHPHLAQYIKNYFEGSETIKYTVSSFITLWRIFLTMLQQSEPCQVVCVLDGLDECENQSLKQLLDAMRTYLSSSEAKSKPRLKLILLSRPQPAVLEGELGRNQRIKLDDNEKEVANDVERYVDAKVHELASEQNLTEEMITQVRQALLAGAEGTFLWVGFVANDLKEDLKGKNWPEIEEKLRGFPRSLGGIYRRLLQQVDGQERLVPILQWIVLAARPLTVEELTAAVGIESTKERLSTDVMKDRLEDCGLMVKVEDDVVNLVHASAKDFFQSDQVNFEGIEMFRMDQHTHRTLMRTCLDVVERSFGSSGGISEKSAQNVLFTYASLSWPEHFRYAIEVPDITSEFSRPFFQVDSDIRDDWWRYYWERERIGGAPPSFTILHLAAYLGNLAWTEMLLKRHAGLVRRKDNYGRTPLSWAANRGHRDIVVLLLDHGAHVNAKDKSDLTALHIAVTGQHKVIASTLIDRNARLESKGDLGDTPLIRAIQADSLELIELLLERGACVDELPTPPGVTSLKSSTEPLESRARELLELQEQLFAARNEKGWKRVTFITKTGLLSFHFPFLLRLLRLFLRFVAFGKWESLSPMQEIVRDNRTDVLRKWANAYGEFYVKLVRAKNTKRLVYMCDVPTGIFEFVAAAELKALLVIAVLVGAEAKLAAVREKWREGDNIISRTFAQWASIAFRRDAEEYLHYGIREFLNDFDRSIQEGNREEALARTAVLLTSQFGYLENKDPPPIEYLARVIAEFYERYIGGSHEEQLFSDANQVFADELSVVSKDHDSARLLLVLTSILQFAQRCREKGQDRFLNMISGSCLILCQNNAKAHRWLIGEAISETLSALIPQQLQDALQKRAYKALVECLIIGRQYGLLLPSDLRRKVKQDFTSFMGLDVTLNQILDV